MEKPNSQKGQGVFEAVLALPLLLTVGFILGSLVYRGWFYYLADYHLHEALLCTESQSASTCKKELHARIKKILLTKDELRIELNKGQGSASGKISLKLTPPLIVEKKYTRFSL